MIASSRRQRQIDFFYAERQSCARLGDVPPDLRPVDKAEGYAVLSGVHQRMRDAGAVLTGYKIGCTTPATQKAQNTDEPTWAGLFAADRYASIANALATLEPPFAVECEIVFRLGRQLGAAAAELSDTLIAQTIEACMIGCEIVQNRYGEPLARGLPTLIADDFFQTGYVLGEPLISWRALDLAALNGVCRIDDQIVETGRSSLVMGGPLNALRWLAVDLAARGRVLQAGDIVFSGSLTTPHWLHARPRMTELHIEAFGALR